jgi:hypothetical protein
MAVDLEHAHLLPLAGPLEGVIFQGHDARRTHYGASFRCRLLDMRSTMNALTAGRP